VKSKKECRLDIYEGVGSLKMLKSSTCLSSETKESTETGNVQISEDVEEESLLIPNKISNEFRFAKRDGVEYDVFSMVFENPTEVDKWMAVKTKHNVMIDPETFQNLKGERIEWVFDSENAIVACKKIYSTH
jgi:PP-loop superfamily ATP-utilizing enzyme